jgi:uncharacterized protein
VWRIRSRVYRWYGQLRTVEQELEASQNDPEVCAGLLKRLDEIEDLVNQISVPLAFADGLYGLRSHINFVRQRVKNALKAAVPVQTGSQLRHEGGASPHPVTSEKQESGP